MAFVATGNVGVPIMVTGNVLLVIIKCLLLYPLKARDWTLRGMLLANSKFMRGLFILALVKAVLQWINS